MDTTENDSPATSDSRGENEARGAVEEDVVEAAVKELPKEDMELRIQTYELMNSFIIVQIVYFRRESRYSLSGYLFNTVSIYDPS